MVVPFLCTETAVKTKEVIEVQFLFCWQFSIFFISVFLFGNKENFSLPRNFIAQNLMIVLRPRRACRKNFCTGSWLPRWEASQEARQLEQSARWEAGWLGSPDDHEVQWDGQAAHLPTVMPAGMQGVGGKPLCLPSCRQKCRGTSLFPRKTSFLWNQNPQMGNCWGNCSTRCFDSHEKLSVREQHQQGCSTEEDKLQAKALHCPGRAVSSPTECRPSGSEQSQRGAGGRIHWWSQTSRGNLSLGPIHRAQAGPGSAQNYLQYRTQEAGLGLLPRRSGQQGTGLGRSTSTAKLRPGLYREISHFSVSLINVLET